MKIRLVGAELFRTYGPTDGRTDTTKLIVAFHDFSKAPKEDPKRISLRRCEGSPAGSAAVCLSVWPVCCRALGHKL